VYILLQGVHLMVIDLFPPGKRDPDGIHKAIWDEFCEEGFRFRKAKPLTLASYCAGDEDRPDKSAFIETIGIGDTLPSMPIFLTPDHYVRAPLETSYESAWKAFPNQLKVLLDPPSP
jgi:hypothetical protein